MKLLNLEGQRYTRLTAIRRVDRTGAHTLWECLCDCGIRSFVTVENLRSGKVRSCGCLKGLKKQIHGEARKGKTTY